MVAELAQALPKINSCKGAASFAKTGKFVRWRHTGLTKMHSTGHAQEATILFQAKATARETQLGKDVEKQNGINIASVAALLKDCLQRRPAIIQHCCSKRFPAGRNLARLLSQLVVPLFEHLCASRCAPQWVLPCGWAPGRCEAVLQSSSFAEKWRRELAPAHSRAAHKEAFNEVGSFSVKSHALEDDPACWHRTFSAPNPP